MQEQYAACEITSEINKLTLQHATLKIHFFYSISMYITCGCNTNYRCLRLKQIFNGDDDVNFFYKQNLTHRN